MIFVEVMAYQLEGSFSAWYIWIINLQENMTMYTMPRIPFSTMHGQIPHNINIAYSTFSA